MMSNFVFKCEIRHSVQATIGKMGLLPVKLEFMEAPYTLSEPPPYAAVCVKIAFESCDSTK